MSCTFVGLEGSCCPYSRWRDVGLLQPILRSARHACSGFSGKLLPYTWWRRTRCCDHTEELAKLAIASSNFAPLTRHARGSDWQICCPRPKGSSWNAATLPIIKSYCGVREERRSTGCCEFRSTWLSGLWIIIGIVAPWDLACGLKISHPWISCVHYT
jgi:hypothetical protein